MRYRGIECLLRYQADQEWKHAKFISLSLTLLPLIEVHDEEYTQVVCLTWENVKGLDREAITKYYKEQTETPAAWWRAHGKPDFHEGHYDSERSQLTMGRLTDDEVANGAFMNYDVRPSIDAIMKGRAFSPIAWMTAAKERIRWLSRRLLLVTHAYQNLQSELELTKQLAMATTQEDQQTTVNKLVALRRMLLHAEIGTASGATGVLQKPLTMEVRMHRGSLSESIKTRDSILNTKVALQSYIKRIMEGLTEEELECIQVVPYSYVRDTRIGWAKTYIVMYKSRDGKEYPLAFTNQPLES